MLKYTTRTKTNPTVVIGEWENEPCTKTGGGVVWVNGGKAAIWIRRFEFFFFKQYSNDHFPMHFLFNLFLVLKAV